MGCNFCHHKLCEMFLWMIIPLNTSYEICESIIQVLRNKSYFAVHFLSNVQDEKAEAREFLDPLIYNNLFFFSFTEQATWPWRFLHCSHHRARRTNGTRLNSPAISTGNSVRPFSVSVHTCEVRYPCKALLSDVPRFTITILSLNSLKLELNFKTVILTNLFQGPI